MSHITNPQTRKLETIIAELPAEKLQTLLDFASYLQQQSVVANRGSAAAILEALATVGPLQFATGELDRLLTEIDTLRQLDMTTDG